MSWLLPVYKKELDLAICKGKTPAHECRYLCHLGSDYRCLKLTENKQMIDGMVEEYEKSFLGRMPFDNKLPVGDNCPGVLHEN